MIPTVKVLIVKLSSLGDLFHVLPTVNSLKTGLNAAIDWAVHPQYLEMAQCFSDVTNVIPLERKVFTRAYLDALRALRNAHYDLVLDAQGILKSAIATRLVKCRRIIGPSFHREGSRLLYHAVAGARNKARHAVHENLDIVRFLGLPVQPPVFPIKIPHVPPPGKSPRVAILPFSRWPTKNWPTTSFIQTGADLQEQAHASIFLVGAAAEQEACAAMAQEMSGNIVNMAGRLSLPELAGFLKTMDLVISNDSGPMHLAAAVGTPVLAIFGPTDPQRTGPFGNGHCVLQGRLNCQPCFANRCRFRDQSCMRAITSATVTTTAIQMLNRTTPSNQAAPSAGKT